MNKLQLIELLLNKHLKEWRFRYSPDKIKITNKLRLDACCMVKNKLIIFNKKYMDRITLKEFKEILLHEIAHALVPDEGHNKNWKDKFKEIGG